MAMRWARSTFLHVIGKNAPAFTVASLAMIIARRPATMPMPVTTPADGAPPHSAYMLPRGPEAEFEEVGFGIDELGDAFAGGEPALLVLALDRLRAAAEADRGFFRGEVDGHCLLQNRITSERRAKLTGCAAMSAPDDLGRLPVSVGTSTTRISRWNTKARIATEPQGRFSVFFACTSRDLRVFAVNFCRQLTSPRATSPCAGGWMGSSASCGTSSPCAGRRGSPPRCSFATSSSSESGFDLSSSETSSSSFCFITSYATSSSVWSLCLAAAEESLEREDAARRLHPLVVHRPAHGRDVDLHLIGDLLHLERLNVLRTGVEERALVVDDGPRHLQQRVPPLFDGLHQPVGRLKFLAQFFLHLVVEVLVLASVRRCAC